MNKQQGSAHVIVVVILVVALLGALGFIFWQNFLKKDEVAKQSETTKTTDVPKTEAEKEPATKTYEATAYSFEYPADGWVADLSTSDGSYGSVDAPTVKTLDYVANIGMGVDSGAYVAVYAGAPNSTLAEMKQNVIETFNATEVKDTTVDGVPALSYRNDYEGTRYVTYVIKNNTSYQIQYQYGGTDPSVYRTGYDTVVKSFKFK